MDQLNSLLRHQRLMDLLKKPQTEINGLVRSNKTRLSIQDVKEKTKKFLFENLKHAFPNKSFDIKKDIENYLDDLKNLPNRTPNGLVLFQKETQRSYCELHKTYSNFLSKTLNLDKIDKLHLPINIRVSFSDPEKEEELLKRPRASQKGHIDVWAGEPLNSFLIFLALFGDVKSSGVEFYNCDLTNVPLHELSDYSSFKAKKLDGPIAKMQMGQLQVADSLLFHRTVKNSKGFRISLDCRGLYKFIFDDENENNKLSELRAKFYKDLDIWCDIGTSSFLETEYSFTNIDIRRKETSINQKSTYPHQFLIR